MLDISLMRRDLDAVVARLEARKSPQAYLDVARFSALESERKGLQVRTEELQARRNALSKQIGGCRTRACRRVLMKPPTSKCAAGAPPAPMPSP